jgi:hypothetical protein
MNTLCARTGVRFARAVSIGLAAAVIAACGGGNTQSGQTIEGSVNPRSSAYSIPIQRAGLSIGSAAAGLSPDSDPVVTPPTNISAVVGEPVDFVAELATQAGDVVTWVSIGGDEETAGCISTYTSSSRSTCRLAPVALAENGSLFAIRVTRDGRDMVFESQPATLTVTTAPVAVVITSEPVGQTVPAGQAAVFSVTAEGTRLKRKIQKGCSQLPCFEYAPPAVQWYKNGVAIPGAITKELVLATVPSDAGQESVITAKVSNGVGATTSEEATLSVASASTVIGATGGNVPGPRGDFLIVPPGALAGDATIAVAEEDVPVGLLPAEFVAVGKIINVTSSAATFSVPVELQIQVPIDIGSDLALAVLRVDELGALLNARVGKLAAASTAAALPASLTCSNPQNTDSTNRTKKKITKPGKLVRGLVSRALCAAVEDLIIRDTMPSTTQERCVKDGDFADVSGTSNDEKTLVSRHVDCRKTIQEEVELTVDLIYNAGTRKYKLLTSPTATLAPVETVENRPYGRATLESRLSVFGPSSGTSKQFRLEVTVIDFEIDVNYQTLINQGAAPSISTMAFKPKFDCTTFYAGSINPACSTTVPEIRTRIPASSSIGSAASASFSVGFNWTKSPTQPQDLEIFKPSLGSYAYKLGTNAYILWTGRPNPTVERTASSGLGNTPKIRCDRGVAKGGTSGCVFVDAAPVFDMKIVNAPESQEHAYEAHRAISGSPGQKAPGKFLLKPGTRAVADSSAEGLTRVKNKPRQDSNYNVSCRGNNALIAIRPANISSSCTVNSSGCECDEFPFKATFNGGAYNPDRTSVKLIRGKQDNGDSGRALGAMLLRERVVDLNDYMTNTSPSANGDKFWVYAPGF